MDIGIKKEKEFVYSIDDYISQLDKNRPKSINISDWENQFDKNPIKINQDIKYLISTQSELKEFIINSIYLLNIFDDDTINIIKILNIEVKLNIFLDNIRSDEQIEERVIRIINKITIIGDIVEYSKICKIDDSIKRILYFSKVKDIEFYIYKNQKKKLSNWLEIVLEDKKINYI